MRLEDLLPVMRTPQRCPRCEGTGLMAMLCMPKPVAIEWNSNSHTVTQAALCTVRVPCTICGGRGER